ncbi:alpha-amylase [Dyadobacter fanqingshengii]|uniref:Alpha-amylase n=1 Tax=Dyadobacter fanqingshengii TaxID=2906443 RepID=A0A9X1PCQ1_9BACT|nr:alpha-amylase [Dyadobacter fanqingshengii]MCF0041273.1 alpha-amylase [Dyadobacter fanqingshengii]USJ37002.1 alpha-amylase [Dyadobacter fanqingshengii]
MDNFTMLQFFEWYCPADGTLWNLFKKEAPRLKNIGIDSAWLPPAHKGMEGAESSGYDSYDLYDLGEFDQKGSVRTKYGTKEELIDAIAAGKEAGLQVYCDIVLNHMGGADEKEMVPVKEVTPENRNEFVSDTFEIEAYTKFTFPGRAGRYSQFVWDYQCFSGVDFNASTEQSAIYSIQNQYGGGWQDVMDLENGNYDYLMLSDIEFRNPHVRQELKNWGEWFVETVNCDGFRLDAIKHMDPTFFNEWLDHLRGKYQKEFYTVGEYWAPYDLGSMLAYIEATGKRVSLFDAPLQANFFRASKENEHYDLRTILDETLVQAMPELAVTLVENHDTQPLQSLEQTVEGWFRPMAYAIILLREAGYPCVFYTDLYGSNYKDKGNDGQEHEITLEKLDVLETLLYVRKKLAYGTQHEYFDDINCIGWTREGDDSHENSGCAVIISNHENVSKTMFVGKQHAGKTFVDYLNFVTEPVTIGDDGHGEFKVNGRSVSVWGIETAKD